MRSSGERRHAGGRVAAEHVKLSDGSVVLIRPVQAADAPVLAEAFERLSDASRESRFLGGKPRLSTRELSALTDIDHHDHEAVGALDPRDGRGLGIARYIRDVADAASAEFAIAVVDEWHHRGLGRELMIRLIRRARQDGIERFTASVALNNRAVLPLLRGSGAVVTVAHRDRYSVEYEISLPDLPA